MSFAVVGSFFASTSASVSLNNQAAGDLILVEIENPDTSVWATSISGGGATWTQLGNKFTGTTNARSAIVFAGKITTAGSQTATITFNGTPTNIRVVGQEFSSTVGSWALDVQGNLDSSGTNTWPSLTPSAVGELYFGYCIDAGTTVVGSTSGYAYHIDSVGNGCAFDPNCTSSAQAPIWGDSSQLFGVMLLVKELSAPNPRSGLQIMGIV